MSEGAPQQGQLDETIFVVGADGMLGSRLVTEFERRGTSVWGSTRNRTKVSGKCVYLDLADTVSGFAPPFSGYGTAIICAAQTSIDQCQREPLATRRINVENTVALARYLADIGMFVVFLSSNSVFDGSTRFPSSGDLPNPQHEYGRQKAEAEKQLLNMGTPTAVIRFSKIVAPDMPLLRGWVRNLRSGEAIHPFYDAVMAPISASFATDLVCQVAVRKRPGITQASASDDISYACAANYLAASIAADTNLVNPTSCKKVGALAFPNHTTLDTRELAELGFEAPPPVRALDQFLDQTPGGSAGAN
jgi:dTDP-4-dehydrorhamnose reductase